ncbi:type VI secretion system protein TssA [Buttiauxella sp. S19-1]|uniref:type VI secretion system protein TssA n=1 Tax=Buttiauxella sp. S19-1 TaxID=941430 RepID=UPI001EDAA958|nr:type VI secretion system protein TssA [Buttiauxella sp. S19-1]
MLSDITAMLVPISPEKPAGENLEYEQVFEDIRQARESDPNYMPQDEWSVKEPKKADWNRVRTLCEKALREKTKDLQIACWFVEALCYQQGLKGLIDGIEFLSEFISRFWFQCWPSLEEEGATLRRSRLLRLDKDLSQQLLCQPLLSQPNTSLIFWRQILIFEHKINSQPVSRDDLIRQEGDLTMESFNLRSMHFSSIEIGQQASRVDVVGAAIAQLEARYLSLSQNQETELFSQTSQTLADITDYLQRLTQHTIPLPDQAITLEPLVGDDITLSEDAWRRCEPQTMSRELAISQMLAIAGYFRQTEPSSPVPFLMERAARWATMTLQEWLAEMINDSNSIHDINNVLTGHAR